MKNKDSHAGWYVGVCTNTTVGMSANLRLTLYATNSLLYGELELAGDLQGGGKVQGTIANEEFAIATVMPAEQTSITWHGRFIGGEIQGTYVVHSNDPRVDPDLREQKGVWFCRLVRPMGDPEASAADSVWVYHDGDEQGPFTMEAFKAGLTTGRWPANAMVGLNDRTVWSSVTEYLAKVQADAATRN